MDKDRFGVIIESIRKVAGGNGGYVLNDQINELIGDEEFDIELIEGIYEKLTELQIDYYDTEEEAQRRLAKRLSKEKKKAATVKKSSRANIKYDDPVRMYLREMGRVPLLTRQGEVDLRGAHPLQGLEEGLLELVDPG